MNFCLPFLVGDPLTLLVALPGADFSFLGLVSFFSGVNPNFSPSDLKFKNKFCHHYILGMANKDLRVS